MHLKSMSLGANIKRIRENKSIKVPVLAAKIEVTRKMIYDYENGVSVPSHDTLYKLAGALGVKVKDLYSDQSEENGTSVKESPAGLEKLVPHYDVIGVGGTKLLADLTPVSEPSEWIYPGTLFRDADAVITVYGDSMWRDFPHMCKVVCREVKNRRLILWGQVYAIETTEYRVVKRVRRGEDKDSIRGESINTVKDAAGKEIHEDLDIQLSDVRRLFLVIGKVDRVQA